MTSGAAIFLTLDVSRLRVSAPGLVKLGDWSYALYLCHLPVFLLALKLAAGANRLVGLVGALGAAFGTLDVWLYARLKSAVDHSQTKRAVGGWRSALLCQLRL